MVQPDSLKHKMIIGCIAAVIIPFIITGIIIYLELSNSLMETAKEKSLLLSNNIAQVLDTFLNANISFVSSIATDPDLIHASKTGEYEVTASEVGAVEKTFKLGHFTLFVTDAKGIIRVDTRFPKQQGLNVSSRDYFIQAQKGMANVSEPVLAKGRGNRRSIIVICSPIYEDYEEKKFLGICGIVFTTDCIARIISRTTTGASGYAYLINKKGVVLAHPDPELVLKTKLFSLSGTEAINEMVRHGRPGIASYTFLGKDKIAGLSQVKHTGWMAAYTRTQAEIMHPVDRLLNYVFISAVIAVFVTIVIIIFISGRISSPIQQMMATVSQVTRYSSEVILQIGRDKKIFFANPVFEKVTGIKSEDVVGAIPLLENTGRIPSRTIWKELQAGNAWSGHLEFKSKVSKNRVILDAMIVPVRDGHGRIQGYLQIGRDITEELMVEKRMSQAQRLEAIGTLSGGVAHDFNNILSIIFGYAELSLLDQNLDPHNKENIHQIILASKRARELVTQILSFSRQGEVEVISVHPGSIIKEALKLIRASTPSFITIQSDIDCTGFVLADPTHIHQVVMNLFTNAVYAIGENPGTITVSLQDFMVDYDFTKKHPDIQEGKHIVLGITDTGAGMSDEIIEHIFEPFFTTKSKKGGTGLGLSVVHGIVRKMNGIITVDSQPGKGSTFNVILPVVEDDAPGDKEINLSVKHGVERIALIDDEINIASAMKSILVNLGYRVTAFTDSTQALEDIRFHPDMFDLIITDYTMPGLTGLEMVKALRNADIQIPAILMSGFLGESILVAANQAGISQLINKPVSTYRIAKTIRKALGD